MKTVDVVGAVGLAFLVLSLAVSIGQRIRFERRVTRIHRDVLLLTDILLIWVQNQYRTDHAVELPLHLLARLSARAGEKK